MIWLTLTGMANAETFSVPDQYTLPEAIEASADGDVIEVRVGAYIDESDPDGVRIEGRTLTIRSDSDSTAWMPPLTIVDSDVTLVNLAWHDRGLNTGVAMQPQTTACPDNDDGCMVVALNSVIDASNLVFDAIIGPAPLGIRDSTVSVDGLTATGNVVTAVVYADAWDADLTVTLNNVSINGYGTALKAWNWSPGDVHAVFHVDTCWLTDNWAEEYAPDLFIGQIQDARLSNCVLSGGTWDGPDIEGAGSVVAIDSMLEIWASEISHTDGTIAGAIWAYASADSPSWPVALGLHGVQLTGNYAWLGSGGAVRADHVDSTITGSDVSENYADRDGGAFSFGGGVHRISNTRLQGNIAYGWGGDIAAMASPVNLAIERSWLCNGESTQGGQIVAQSGGSLHITGTILETQETALLVDDADVLISHSTAVLDAALLGGSGGSLELFSNVLVSDSAILEGPRALETVDHNLWDAPQTWAGSSTVGEGGILGHAELISTFTPGACSWGLPPELDPDSPAVDAGRREYTDLDGTCPDMGAFGGLAPYGWDGSQAPTQDLCGGSGSDTGDTGDPGDSGLDGSSPLLGGGCPGGLSWASALLLVGLGLRRRRT
jgi:hypothetical protein